VIGFVARKPSAQLGGIDAFSTLKNLHLSEDALEALAADGVTSLEQFFSCDCDERMRERFGAAIREGSLVFMVASMQALLLRTRVSHLQSNGVIKSNPITT
jgi:hypothetical protein